MNRPHDLKVRVTDFQTHKKYKVGLLSKGGNICEYSLSRADPESQSFCWENTVNTRKKERPEV
jgi:hypothetical protein